MDKTKNLTIEEKIELMKEDYNNEWWRPSKIDNFELRNKVNEKLNLVNESRMSTNEKEILKMFL